MAHNHMPPHFTNNALLLNVRQILTRIFIPTFSIHNGNAADSAFDGINS
jgi:hypothetical protein